MPDRTIPAGRGFRGLRVAAVLAVLLTFAPWPVQVAGAVAPTTTAWWSVYNRGFFPPPAPPDVGEGDLYVQGAEDGAADAVSGLIFEFPSNRTPQSLQLPIGGAGFPAQGTLLACRATADFASAENAPWADVPSTDCSAAVASTIDGAAGVIRFDNIAPLAESGKLRVVLIPSGPARAVISQPGADALVLATVAAPTTTTAAQATTTTARSSTTTARAGATTTTTRGSSSSTTIAPSGAATTTTQRIVGPVPPQTATTRQRPSSQVPTPGEPATETTTTTAGLPGSDLLDSGVASPAPIREPDQSRSFGPPDDFGTRVRTGLAVFLGLSVVMNMTTRGSGRRLRPATLPARFPQREQERST